ncbi:MAG: hypothetical protein ACOCVF_03135 [bacterium]
MNMGNINQIDDNGNKVGYWEQYYPNGKLFYKGNYVDGKGVGYWEWYYSNGKLSSKGNYDENGKQVGCWEYYRNVIHEK